RVAPESKIRANAQYDAAAELLTLKEWERAIGVLQDFRRQFPQHQLQPEVARKLAVAYSEANRPGEAAAEFERIASNPAESRSVQREALMQSADLYSKAGNNPRAMGMLEKFVDTNPTPLADAEEARQRLADYAGKSGDGARRDRWSQEIDRRHLRDGVAVRRARQGHPGLGAAREAQGRCAGGIQLTPRGAGISVRGAGDQGARAERRARQGRGVRRVGAQELPGARAAQARA